VHFLYFFDDVWGEHNCRWRWKIPNVEIQMPIEGL
jgi:hypothetical protein